MRTIVSEIALEALLHYNDRGPEYSERVSSALRALAEDNHDRQVLRVSGSPRPIWIHPLDDDLVIYFTYGQGADSLELRITFIGSSPSDSEFDLGRALRASGDVPYHEIPDSIRLYEHRAAAATPEFPERTLGRDGSLENYLAPTDDTLLAAIAETNKDIDDLNGRRYRILTGLRPAQELPVRLSPQQERLLGSPLPLLLQGVAGSGKTTIVARFAHRQILKYGETPSVLVIT